MIQVQEIMERMESYTDRPDTELLDEIAKIINERDEDQNSDMENAMYLFALGAILAILAQRAYKRENE